MRGLTARVVAVRPAVFTVTSTATRLPAHVRASFSDGPFAPGIVVQRVPVQSCQRYVAPRAFAVARSVLPASTAPVSATFGFGGTTATGAGGGVTSTGCCGGAGAATCTVRLVALSEVFVSPVAQT